MIPQQSSINKIKEQVGQFAELLTLEYGVPVNLQVRFSPITTRENSIQMIINHVSQYYDIPIYHLTRKGRKREVVEARQIAIYLIHKVFKLTKSLKDTGLWFGGQDHSTIIHAMKTVEDLKETDRKYAFHLKEVQESIELRLVTPEPFLS